MCRWFHVDGFFWKTINKVSKALKDLSSDISKYIKSIMWSLLSQLMLYFGGYFIAHSVVESIDFLSWVILYPVIVALSSLPITFSGIGLREYLFIIFSESLGFQESELVLVVSFLILLSILSQSVLGAFVYFFINRSKVDIYGKKMKN